MSVATRSVRRRRVWPYRLDINVRVTAGRTHKERAHFPQRRLIGQDVDQRRPGVSAIAAVSLNRISTGGDELGDGSPKRIPILHKRSSNMRVAISGPEEVVAG